MTATFTFITPRGHLTRFYFVSVGGSTRYNFMQVWKGTVLTDFFGIVPVSTGVLYGFQRQNAPVEYTLKAFAQVPGTPNATQSNSEATVVPSTKPGDQEWLLRIQGDEGKQVQVSLLTTPVEPTARPLVGNGQLI
jgi:hypothetical protein